MSTRSASLVVLALLAFVAAPDTARSQPATEPAPPAPYVLTIGDMMNTLIQPRHAKLGLAGRAQNWALTAYALVELRESFAGIVKAQPKFRGLPVAELVDAAMKEPLAAVDAAVKAQDAQKFAAAYASLTAGCNACHASVDHPFVVIKPPDAPAFPNQDFAVH